MSNSTFLTVEGCQFIDLSKGEQNIYQVLAFGRICTDGTGPHHGDKTAQNRTAYTPYLNADVDPYVVTPPQFRRKAKGVVLGCRVLVENLANGKTAEAVCGEVGPDDRCGEMARVLAVELDLDPHPNSGGINRRQIRYTFYPGEAAVIHGRTYKLIRA